MQDIDYGSLPMPASDMLVEAVDSENYLLDVLDAANGKACNCTCPECGEPVIAKQGKTVAWHYAHLVDSTCSGEGARHLRAKDYIARVFNGDVEVNYPGSDYRADAYAGGIYFEVVDTSWPSAEKNAFITASNLPVVCVELPRHNDAVSVGAVVMSSTWHYANTETCEITSLSIALLAGLGRAQNTEHTEALAKCKRQAYMLGKLGGELDRVKYFPGTIEESPSELILQVATLEHTVSILRDELHNPINFDLFKRGRKRQIRQ